MRCKTDGGIQYFSALHSLKFQSYVGGTGEVQRENNRQDCVLRLFECQSESYLFSVSSFRHLRKS